MSKFFAPQETVEVPFATVIIMGDPKLGKTRLAAQFPRPYFLDVDNGAAHTGSPRMTFEKNARGYAECVAEIKRLALLKPGADGLLHHKVDGFEFPIGTVVLDSISEFQVLAAAMLIRGADTRKFYGDLRYAVRDPITMFRSIDANLVIVAHTATKTEERSAGKHKEVWDWVGVGLEGSVRDDLLKWVDLMLNIVNDPQKGQQYIITRETTIGQRIFQAGDRYNLFHGQQLPLLVNDNLNPEVVPTILGIVAGGSRKDTAAQQDDSGKQSSSYVPAWQRILQKAGRNANKGLSALLEWVEENGHDPQEARDLLSERFGRFDLAAIKEMVAALEEFWAGQNNYEDADLDPTELIPPVEEMEEKVPF